MSLLFDQIDAAILGLNPLTGQSEDSIWRPADKARDALIAAKAALHAAAVTEKVSPGHYTYLNFTIEDHGYGCAAWFQKDWDLGDPSGVITPEESKRYGGYLGAAVRDIDEFLEDQRATVEQAGAEAGA